MAKSGPSERIHPGGQATKFEVSKVRKPEYTFSLSEMAVAAQIFF
jgi:hypothetical protein